MANSGTAVVIRPVVPTEVESWLTLVNQFRYWQDDVSAVRFDDSLRLPDETILRIGAWTSGGTMVGAAEGASSEEGSRYDRRAASRAGVAGAQRRARRGTPRGG